MPGYLFYDGPSLIDKSPILGIVTYDSDNPKTGNLAQTWIIRKDMHPINAVNTGEDYSICGNCPMRGSIGQSKDETKNTERACYVMLQGVGQIYNAYRRGLYSFLDYKDSNQTVHFKEIGLRYGSYGDPVAIPKYVWNKLREICGGSSKPGYTHQWNDKRFSHWSKYLMASTHSDNENNLAKLNGWRTFRTIKSELDIAENEILCPASPEAGSTRTCETCGACNGRRDLNDSRKSIAIVVHGSGGKVKYASNVISNSSLKIIDFV